MKYPLAERFAAPQGEGLYTGVPMKFIRFVGCSVGKGICAECDTNFEEMYPKLGGGLYEVHELVEWALPYKHVCLTGGEPLDRDLSLLTSAFYEARIQVHIETSGTKKPKWFLANTDVWLCVSPKPGYLTDMIGLADEVKVIVGGLGDGPGWPSIDDAIRWANQGKLVYIQPRNDILTINGSRMNQVLDIVDAFPQLRLSAQLHKYLRTR